MTFRRLSTPGIYWIVFFSAFLMHGKALENVENSPLGRFFMLPGLDMKTHLELGALFARGQCVFSIYRLICAVVPDPAWLIRLQYSAGVLTALLTVFIARRLFRHRSIALLAGLCAALYGNAMLYEMVTLPEAFHVLIAAGAFAALLQARRRQFSPGWTVLAGAMLALLGTGRPVSVIAVFAALGWAGYWLCRKKQFRRARYLALGLLIVWLPVTIRNAYHGWPLPVYGSNFAYAARVAEKTEMTSWNVEPETGVRASRMLTGAVMKIPKVLSIREIPDNLNYSFLREKLTFMRWTLPVAALVILALSGMAVLLLRKNRRGMLLIAWCIALAVVFTVYYPVGRYRLILYPYAAVFAGFWLDAIRKPGRTVPLLAGMLIAAVEWIAVPDTAVRRAADHTAWGLAAMRMPCGAEITYTELCEAVRMTNGGVRETARLLDWLLRNNALSAARKVLREYPGNDPYRRYYTALIGLADGDALNARRQLEALPPESVPELRGPYWYFLGEACRSCGDPPAAVRAYQELLKLPVRPEMRKDVEKKISGLK